MQEKIEKRNNYVKINKFSKEINQIKLIDNQRKLFYDLILEMQELNLQLNQIIKVDKKSF